MIEELWIEPLRGVSPDTGPAGVEGPWITSSR